MDAIPHVPVDTVDPSNGPIQWIHLVDRGGWSIHLSGCLGGLIAIFAIDFWEKIIGENGEK